MNGGTWVGKALKGVYSALIAGLGSMSAILVGPTTVSQVTAGQWTVVALAALTAAGGTYGLSGWSGPGGK